MGGEHLREHLHLLLILARDLRSPGLNRLTTESTESSRNEEHVLYATTGQASCRDPYM